MSPPAWKVGDRVVYWPFTKEPVATNATSHRGQVVALDAKTGGVGVRFDGWRNTEWYAPDELLCEEAVPLGTCI